jgi:hypothetical protein
VISFPFKELERAVNDLKVCVLHQESELINLEFLEPNVSHPYLHFNSSLENVHKYYVDNIKSFHKKIHEIQKRRREVQEKIYPQLQKFESRKFYSINQRLSCDSAFARVNSILNEKGFSYVDCLRDRFEAEEMKQKPFDHQYNSTVREYESTNEFFADDDHVENSPKRQKISS